METQFGLWDFVFVEILTILFFRVGARPIGFGDRCRSGVWCHCKFGRGLTSMPMIDRCEFGINEFLIGSQGLGFEALFSEFKVEIR